MNSAWRFPISVLLIFIVLTGIGFRFYNLDKKVFWLDEASTAHRIAGYSQHQIQTALSHKQEWPAAEVMQFQRLAPERGVDTALRALAADDPKHPPFYYLTLRIWAGQIGDSVFAIRLFSALLSLLVFPALWWLCRELFAEDPNKYLIAVVALALLAVSPFHVLYAQEAREYSLWAAVLAASSAIFIRALRTGDWQWWTIYAFGLAVSVYTHTLSALLWTAQAATIGVFLWQQRQRKIKNASSPARPLLLSFVLASLGAVVLFSPWLLQIVLRQENLSNNTSWLAEPSSLTYLIQTWISLPGLIFFDPNQTQRWTVSAETLTWAIPLVRVIRVLLCILVLGALIFVWRHAPKRSAAFIVMLAIVPFLAVATPDVLLDGYRSTIARFAIPCFLGGHLAVAYLIATKLAAPSTQRLGTVVFTTLLCTGLFSCALSSQAQVWWNKSYSYHLPQIARVINAQQKPLVIINNGFNFLALSRILNPDVTLFVLKEEETLDPKALEGLLGRKTETVLFYNPLPEVKENVQKHGAVLKPSPDTPELWTLEKS